MRELAEELKTDDDAESYADRMAQELAELFQAEEDRAAKEIERRQVRGRRRGLGLGQALLSVIFHRGAGRFLSWATVARTGWRVCRLKFVPQDTAIFSVPPVWPSVMFVWAWR